MSEWTLRRLLAALRPLNMTRESSEFSRPHDSLRIHLAELNFGIVFPRSNSRAVAVSEGNPSLTQLTRSDIGVLAAAARMEHKRRFLSHSCDAESLQSYHTVHELRLPLPLRLLCLGILWVCGTWRSFTASTVGRTFP